MRLNSIQYLRGIAALSVSVLHTLNIVAYMSGTPILGKPILSAGVDIFFVISGFIIYSISRSGFNAASFLLNRFFRLVPMYWLFTIAFLPVALLSHLRSGVNFFNIIKSLLFVPYEHGPILGVGWTLNYEVFFYMIFALFMMINRNKALIILTVFFTGLIVGARSLQLTEFSFVETFYTSSLLFEFLFGAYIGYVFEKGWLTSRAFGISASVTGCVLLIANIYLGEDVWTSWQFLNFGIPAALIVMGMISAECSGIAFKSKPMLFLGASSYTMYLVHSFPIYGMAFVVKTRLWPQGNIGLLLFFVLTISGIIFITAFLHTHVEKRFLAIGHRLVLQLIGRPKIASLKN